MWWWWWWWWFMQILNSIRQRKSRWTGHVLRHDGLLREITAGRMTGKPTRWRRRIQMLRDLANGDSFVALKRAAEDRQRWRNRERMSKTSCTAENYWWRPFDDLRYDSRPIYVWAVALKPKYIRKHVGMTAASGSAATAVTSLWP